MSSKTQIFHLAIQNYNKMKFTIALEWEEQSGLLLGKLYPLRDGIEGALKDRSYGTSIARIGTIMTCRPKDFKQRKRFKKDTKEFTYDILLDYFLIKNAELQEKKAIIRRQMVEITESTFSNYKFDDFDKATFLTDFKEIVTELEW